uniref:Neutrophil cytosolic factor 2 n=1 Tax=Lates calcarifer TaxID=8187 RepID=A0A4W6FZ63_LATCA
MSFVDTLRQWDEAVTCVDRQDLAEAYRIFLSIQEPNSKICFDIGCLHLLNQDLDAAEKAFDCSIRKDEHLAVAFFQRGVTFYKKQRYEESLGDFQRAFKALRGNQLIDYKALGLRYILYACDVLHNMALVEAQLGNWEKAQENLVKALDYKTEAKLNTIDRALQSTLVSDDVVSVIIFGPIKLNEINLSYSIYLNVIIVVASVVPQDDFSGFAPLQPQVEDGPACPKEPEVLRALEGEPHTVLFEFVPETSDELAVVPGNIVVRSDTTYRLCTSRGLVPYNYLERLEISLASKQNGVRTELLLTYIITPLFSSFLSVNRFLMKCADEQSPDNSYIVKVRFTFTFTISVPPESPYTALIEKISKKLNVPAKQITLSLTPEADEQSVIDANTKMECVWSRAKDRHITLWCKTTELDQTDGKPHSEIHLVALHSYESSNPEDLNFQQGDKITLLSRVNQDWLEGQCNGNTGIFPAAFVEEVPVNGQ